MSWSEVQLEAVLRLTALFGPGSFRVVTQGKPVRPAAYRDRGGWVRWEAIEQLRAAGASLNLTRVEDYSNDVLHFARALEAELQCPAQINAYTTPGRAQGLGAHTDPHDVLVHQLQGRKTWNVAGLGTLTLEPGDWLFVPRDTLHEVRNLEPEPTSHLAIGLHPLTWGDFWQTVVETARKSIPALALAVEPAATLAGAREKLAADLLPVLSAAAPDAARRRYHDTFRNFGVPVPADHIGDPAARESIGLATTLCWRQPDATVRRAPEFLELDLPYRRAPLTLRPELENALRFMQEAAQFHVAENLPGLDAGSGLMLCRLLADIGALRVLP